MEFYGEQGIIHMSNLSFFGGELRYINGSKRVKVLPKYDCQFSMTNERHVQSMIANYCTD